MTPKPPKVEPMAAHPIKPTDKWKALQNAEAKTVRRTAAERAERDRERKDSTDYTSAQRAHETGE
jgi:hypothetical protein